MRVAAGAARLPRIFPAALALTVAVTLIGVLTSTVFRSDHQWILDHAGMDLDALKSGRLWTMPAATLIQAEAGIKWHQALVVLIFVGLLEYMAGSSRALVTFFVTDWISSLLTALFLWGLATLGSARADGLLHTPDAGSSAAAFGAVAAGAVMLRSPLREVTAAGVLGYLIAAFTFQRLDVATAHLIAAVLGGALGWFSWRHHPARSLSKKPMPDK